MEKRSLYFFFLAILFLVIYTYLVSKFTPSTPLPQKKETKIEKEEETFIEKFPSSSEVVNEEVKNFSLKIFLTGGYIKNIFLKKYQEELLFEDIGFIPKYKDVKFNLKKEKNKIILSNNNLGIRKEFEFEDYLLKLKFFLPHKNVKSVIFSQVFSPKGLERRYQEIFYKKNNRIIFTKPYHFKKIKGKNEESLKFVGARDRYYCLCLLEGSYTGDFKKGKKKIYFLTLIPQKESLWKIYVGPQVYKELKPFHLEEIINYGMFHSLGVVILKLLYLFNSFTKNWGLSIIFLSAVIFLILFPFTAKSTKAMKKMQEFQPKIEEIQKKYKDNPQKQQKAILELYKKHKINPLGGCLPIFFQFPIFIALYQVLLRFIELKGARFLWIKDLSLPDQAFKLPISLPFLGNYINLLPIFIIILGLLQQKVTSKETSSSQQKIMGLYFVVFLGVIFYNFPSGLVLYWLTQNILTLIFHLRTSSFLPK